MFDTTLNLSRYLPKQLAENLLKNKSVAKNLCEKGVFIWNLKVKKGKEGKKSKRKGSNDHESDEDDSEPFFV